MFDKFQNPLALAARILLAVLFVPAGISKIAGFAGTVGYISSVGLPLPAVGAVLAILAEAGGGIALLLGFQTRLAALALAIFSVVAGFFFHAFWSVPADQVMVNQIMFMKNIAIAGGLLALVAFGPGKLSLDAKQGR
ncbi:DoxX family protein [uncultured Rhodoferax sp.]|uniref:DoxX family protein n=1 Tax=uncultured Rhodoferax sp. TaxID=223188 RepID=UPI0025D57118|nr:DoxX family protein [uncultured Rhodoferax sp.]